MMRTAKRIVGLAMALMLTIGVVSPNLNANANDNDAFDVSTIEGISASFEGFFWDTEKEIVTEHHPEGPITYEGFNVHMLEPTVTVSYKDGSSDTYSGSYEVHQKMMEKFGQCPTFRTAQDETPFTVGSTNPVEVYFMDNDQFHCTTYVTVKETPIESMRVEATKPLYDGTYEEAEWWIDEDTCVPYKRYDVNYANPVITLVMKDGSEKTYSLNSYLLYEDFERWMGWSDGQSYENEWGVGKHTVAAQFMGKTCEFEVEIVPSPVKDIKAKYHGVCIEGTNTFADESKIEYIFTFTDGTTESFYMHEEVYGQYLYPDIEALDPLEDDTWDAGEHYWVTNLWGKEVRIPVNVLSKSASPIKSISAVATNDLILGVHEGGFGGEVDYILADYCNPKVTLTYTDGSQETMVYQALQSMFNGVEPSITLDNDPLDTPGKRTATMEFYGCTCTFEINVIENPVDHISAVTTKPLVEGWRDFYSLVYDGGLIVTVHYKDGTSISGTADELLPVFYDFPHEELSETVSIGKNKATLHFLEKTCEVEFELIEDPNPVVGIDAKVKDGAVLYEKAKTAAQTCYNYDHIVDVTLRYKDGSTLTGSIAEVNKQLHNISIREVWTDDSQWDNEWAIGKHSVTVGYMDFEKNVEVEVVENPYAKATISGNEDFKVVMEKKNGEKEVYQADRFMEVGTFGSSLNLHGYLETDKGILPVEIKFAGGRQADYTNISYMIIQGVKSNAIQNCEWMEQQFLTELNGDVPKVIVNNSYAELKELVLTDKDYIQDIVDGVEAWLDVSDKSEKTTAEERVLLDKATQELANYKEGIVLDFTLYKKSYSINSGEILETVSEPNGTVSITMAVPEAVLASGTDPSTIKMIRIHDGKTQVIPCTYDAATKMITFETDAFSTYSLVYESVVSPKTGDTTSFVWMFMAVAALGVALVIAERKKCVK